MGPDTEQPDFAKHAVAQSDLSVGLAAERAEFNVWVNNRDHHLDLWAAWQARGAMIPKGG